MNPFTRKTLAYKILVAFIYCFISTQICNAALLVWDNNSEYDLAGYHVYYGDSPGNYRVAVDVGNVTAYKLEDLGFQEDSLYYIAITAYDTSGNESDFSTGVEYFADDGVPYDADNCPGTYNPDQEDTYPPKGNGIGDACDCEGDFDCDGDVDKDDIREFLLDFGRGTYNDPCTNDWCNGDINCDGTVASDDVIKMLEDFGRNLYNNPCPDCGGGDWCSY